MIWFCEDFYDWEIHKTELWDYFVQYTLYIMLLNSFSHTPEPDPLSPVPMEELIIRQNTLSFAWQQLPDSVMCIGDVATCKWHCWLKCLEQSGN